MGKCNILVNQFALDTLARDYPNGKAVLTRVVDWGEGLYYADLESVYLPDGYHGVQDVIFDGENLKFRMDVDV